MTLERKINNSTIRFVKGDITEVAADALVYYARSDLALGSGFGTAISMQGGRSIQDELNNLAPVNMGQSVVSSAGEMKVKYIIHAVGPKFMEENMEDKLRAAMSNALKQAEEKGIKSVVFPPMGTGFYGVPLDMCARVMNETITRCLEGETSLEEVIICLRDLREHKAFEAGRMALN